MLVKHDRIIDGFVTSVLESYRKIVTKSPTRKEGINLFWACEHGLFICDQLPKTLIVTTIF